jgi:hypothetical protein
MITKLKASRKNRLQYWFYAGAAEEKGDRDKDSIIDELMIRKISSRCLKRKCGCTGRFGLSGVARGYSRYSG